jgi:hypothetical protein
LTAVGRGFIFPKLVKVDLSARALKIDMMNELFRSEPPPPWVKYPGTDPSWGGWRQGVSEAWLHDVWLPFWQGITANERTAFLIRNSPPSDEWGIYLEQYWKY